MAWQWTHSGFKTQPAARLMRPIDWLDCRYWWNRPCREDYDWQLKSAGFPRSFLAAVCKPFTLLLGLWWTIELRTRIRFLKSMAATGPVCCMMSLRRSVSRDCKSLLLMLRP